ncbi:reverse transcriptase domain-containing protein, partial [Tanacetum coccineum]
MTPIQEYINREILPEDATEARTIKDKVWNYVMEDSVLYRKFGIPAVIITDNGTQLINDLFKSWAEGLGIKLVSTSVYHPQANGAVERANRSIITTPKAGNGATPFSLAYGTEAVIPAEIGIPTRQTLHDLDEENDKALRLNLNLLEEGWKITTIKEARRKQLIEKYYNQR